MTIKKFNEQTIRIQTPDGTDTYTQEQAKTYEVEADIDDVSGATTVFTANEWNQGSTPTNFTWTCPSTGVYELQGDSGNSVSNSINIYVDDTKVVSNDGTNSETNIVRTVRVLYPGQKIKFYFYNVEHSRMFTARVRKIGTSNLSFGTTNDNAPEFYYDWPVKEPNFVTRQL